MTISIGVLTASLSREAGGLYGAISSLVQQMNKLDISVNVYGGRDSHTYEDDKVWQKKSMALDVSFPKFFRYMPTLNETLKSANLDILHTHGLWLYPSIAANHWFKNNKKPIVISPHGMLDSWALKNSNLKKRLAALLFEDKHLSSAACLHALCRSEAESMRNYGLKNPICIIPNGIDFPVDQIWDVPNWRKNIPKNHKILLFLGRIHPKKGLTQLLTAWDGLSQFNDAEGVPWHLAIAGWDDGGHLDGLLKQHNQMLSSECVHFIGPQYGVEKWASFAHSDGFILPSYSEGLPMAVLEAWAQGLPALLTPECNLPEGFEMGAAVPISTVPEALSSQLHQFLMSPQVERNKMGHAGKKLVLKSFTWPKLAGEMIQVYQWLLGELPQPNSIVEF